MKLYNELAEYYFSIENNHRDIDNDISLIRSLLHGEKNPSLLDLGCGTGEHLSRLSRYGIKCTGLDRSEEMLKHAMLRFPHKIDFIKCNITDFDYYNEFDIVISLFGSMDYLIEDSEVDRTLWNVWRALKPEGLALFEIWNSLPIEMIKNKKIDHVSTTLSEGVLIERERGFKRLNNYEKTIVQVDYSYKVTDPNESKIIEDRHIMRAFTKNEMTAYLSENGFIIQNIFANALKEPYQDYSNKMLILAKKA